MGEASLKAIQELKDLFLDHDELSDSDIINVIGRHEIAVREETIVKARSKLLDMVRGE